MKNKASLKNDLILHGEIDLVYITETWMREEEDVTLTLTCPPGFGIRNQQLKGWGAGVAVVYRNNIAITIKPVQQQ